MKIDYKKLTFAVITIAILLRFFLASVHSVSGDACWQLSASRFIAENGRIPLNENFGRQEPFWAPPLFHIMAAFMYKLFSFSGFAEFGMKMLSPLLGSMTLIFIYLINRRLFSEKITFYSMLFTSFIPIFIDYHVFGYVDGAITLFAVVSIYFALEGKYIRSSIAAGLCAMTKYNGIFIVPLLAYITYKKTANKRIFLKRLFVILAIISLIAAPWFIRNYARFNNPVWPFLNFIFNGMGTSGFESADVQSFSFSRIFHLNSVIYTYLAVFGVPDGNFSNIFFFNIPNIEILLGFWLAATLFFMIPLINGMRPRNDASKIIWIWILSYAFVLALYIGNSSWSAARFFIPAIPALGMLWGIGISGMNFKSSMLKRLFFVLIFLSITGFVAAETTKIYLASGEWKSYSTDFEWIRQNTKETGLILPGAQCLSYYTGRGTLKPSFENAQKADYIFANKNFRLEPRSIISQNILDDARNRGYVEVYENKNTGTSIYSRQ